MSTKALREGFGWWEVDDFEVSVRGPDRIRFLNGMLTQDMGRLEPGRGAWAVKATAKGRVQGLLRVRLQEDQVRLDIPRVCGETVVGALVDYLVADDCEMEDETEALYRIMVVGEGAADRLSVLDAPVPADDLHVAEQGDIRVVRDHRFGVPGFELAVPAHLRARLRLEEDHQVSEATRQVLRVEAGVPEMGAELDEEVIALEAGLMFAIEAHKGCYVGQETIARAMNLGRVRYGLVGFRSATEIALGSLFGPQGKSVGDVTSQVRSDVVGAFIGIGFLRNEVEDSALPEGLSATALPHVPSTVSRVFEPTTQRS